MSTVPTVTEDAVREALSTVEDPELNKPITELGMVKSIAIDGADVAVEIYLTIAACPMKSTLTSSTREATEGVEGVERVTVTTDVMSDEQRREHVLRGGKPNGAFRPPESTTRVYAVASGKGGVGKSR